MLPWENLPVLRNQQVYRMPSISSIRATLIKCCPYQQQVQLLKCYQGSPMEQGVPSHSIPSIDPLDSYYLLNPSGDLSSTQIEFESWFRDQDFEVLFYFTLEIRTVKRNLKHRISPIRHVHVLKKFIDIYTLQKLRSLSIFLYEC